MVSGKEAKIYKSSRKINYRQPKIYKLAKDKKKFVWPSWFKYLIIVVAVTAVVFWFFMLSNVFEVKRIEIIGPSEGKLDNLQEKIKGQNIFLLKDYIIKNDLEKNNPEFLNIQVYKGIPNVLRIKFQEREAKIIWQSGSNKYLVDRNGILFKQASEKEIGLPLVIDGNNLVVKSLDQVVSSNFIEFIRNANSKSSEYGFNVKHFEVGETTFQIKAFTENLYLFFDTTKSLENQLEIGKKIYKEHKNDIHEYIDTRVEGWVYYK